MVTFSGGSQLSVIVNVMVLPVVDQALFQYFN